MEQREKKKNGAAVVRLESTGGTSGQCHGKDGRVL